MIRLVDVTYTYPQAGQPALREINLEIPDGSFTAVVGANGSGKSTLCAAIAGFIPHHFRGDLKGRVLVDDLDTAVAPLTEIVLQVGLVFQNPFNQLSHSHETVAEEVAFGLENLGVARPEMLRRVEDILRLIGLEELSSRSPDQLSGGELQRVALASVLVMEPPVLILDEPTAQLDPVGTRQVFTALRSIVNARHCTVLLVEQKVEWIAAFADRVIALQGGQVVIDGRGRDVLSSPRLLELGVMPTRYALAAQRASALGLWPREIAFPTTLDQAVEGFQKIATPVQGQDG